MNLWNLAPAIQERILLHPPVSAAQDEVHERVLRRVAACLSWAKRWLNRFLNSTIKPL